MARKSAGKREVRRTIGLTKRENGSLVKAAKKDGAKTPREINEFARKMLLRK